MASFVGILVAVSEDGVIGQAGRMPWHEPADLARFKRLTVGHAVVMGRKTWQALPRRPLPDRDNVVITRADLPGVTCARSPEAALAAISGQAWLIGGAAVYAAGYALADLVDVTRVPHWIGDEDVVRLPPIPTDRFTRTAVGPHPDDPRLVLERWQRRDR